MLIYGATGSEPTSGCSCLRQFGYGPWEDPVHGGDHHKTCIELMFWEKLQMSFLAGEGLHPARVAGKLRARSEDE